MGRTFKHMRKYNIGNYRPYFKWFTEIPSKFKKFKRKQRRLKEKLALKIGKIIPIFKKSDRYDYF